MNLRKISKIKNLFFYFEIINFDERIIKPRLESLRAELSKDGKTIFLASIFAELSSSVDDFIKILGYKFKGTLIKSSTDEGNFTNIDAKNMVLLSLESLRSELSKDSKIIFLTSIFMKLLSYEV
jgi:hypothetical protein